MAEPPELTHQDREGRARMVDVGDKPETARIAVAQAIVVFPPAVRAALLAGRLPKGEALATARIAGIQAAKETPRLIPLCHPLALSRVAIDFEPSGDDRLVVRAEVACTGRTGVEMEALTAAAVAALTLYDMAKAASKGICIERIELLAKSGGRSGDWHQGDP